VHCDASLGIHSHESYLGKLAIGLSSARGIPGRIARISCTLLACGNLSAAFVTLACLTLAAAHSIACVEAAIRAGQLWRRAAMLLRCEAFFVALSPTPPRLLCSHEASMLVLLCGHRLALLHRRTGTGLGLLQAPATRDNCRKYRRCAVEPFTLA